MTDDLQPISPVPGDEPPPDVIAASAPVDAVAPPSDDGDIELLRLIDRLAALLDRSDLTELEVESGGTGLVLRKPAALAPISVTNLSASSAAAATVTIPPGGESSAVGRESTVAAKPSVKAPLTGIFYASPAPGSAPYVAVGGEVAVGQVIGLIEAMKLFNEIKSDLAGRVVRVVAESGALVKAKQPLIEVEPL
ncbi:MAG: acetyl-CoA carboxylase biotin carboxyl carrier protein [Chloroflexota bacterium]|jgi:acetyl-CoA carboxylase biotin carboxyl carrier protein